MVLILSHLLLVSGIDLAWVPLVLHEILVLLFPALKLLLQFLVLVFFLNACALALLSGAAGGLILFLQLLNRQFVFLVVHHDFRELLLGALAESLLFHGIHLLVVLGHHGGELLVDGLQLVVVDNKEKVSEHL